MEFHGKPLGDKCDYAINHLRTLIKNPEAKLVPEMPNLEGYSPQEYTPLSLPDPEYKLNEVLATRSGYGNSLKKLGELDS